MSDVQKLADAYSVLKTGTLWHNPNLGDPKHPCKGFADANPVEAAQIDAYVAGIAAGQAPAPPALTTATGRGIVGVIDSGFAASPPALTVSQSFHDGDSLTAPAVWTAVPSVPVVKVEFFVDGILKWTETLAPYQFNGDPAGMFDPAAVTDGKHILSVHATDLTGQVAADSATVTTQASAPPPPPPSGDWRDRVGFATGDLFANTGDYVAYGIGGQPQSRFPALAKEAGARLLRFSWYGVNHDDEVNLVLSYGLKPVLTFQPIQSISDAAISGCVTKFKGKVPYYELGNEPDLHGISPASYAALVKRIAPLIKQADPAAKVLTGGLWLGTSTTARPDAYCKALIAAGAFADVDMFTLHYPDDGGMEPYMATCRSLLDAAGLGRVGLASTEGGGGKGTTDDTQAARCQQFLDWVKDGTLQLGTNFSIWVDYDMGYQFVQANGTKRKAFTTFQQAVA